MCSDRSDVSIIFLVIWSLGEAQESVQVPDVILVVFHVVLEGSEPLSEHGDVLCGRITPPLVIILYRAGRRYFVQDTVPRERGGGEMRVKFGRSYSQDIYIRYLP